MTWGIQVYLRKIILKTVDYFNQSIEMTEDESIKASYYLKLNFILSNDKILFKKHQLQQLVRLN